MENILEDKAQSWIRAKMKGLSHAGRVNLALFVSSVESESVFKSESNRTLCIGGKRPLVKKIVWRKGE